MKKQYNAFISYAHSSEMDLAVALETALERYAKPLFKMRALDVYRDTVSQPLTSDLLDAVHKAMDRSEHLILLASPESTRSKWVPKELMHWCEQHGVDKLIVVLCAGEISWDDQSGDFNWDKTTALPDCLSGQFNGCPLYLDLSWARGNDDLNQHNPQFKEAVSRLSATLHGKSIDDMYSEEAKQFRRTRRIKNFTIAGLTSLFIVACITAFMAVIAANEAIYQRDVAIKKNLVNEVRNQLNNNQFIRAIQIARATREVFGKDFDADKVLWQLVSHPTTVLAQWNDQAPDGIELSDNNDWLMVWTRNNDETSDVSLYNWKSGRTEHRDGVLNAWFIDDGKHLLEVLPLYASESWAQNQSVCEAGRMVLFDGEWQRVHAYSSIVDLETGKNLAWPNENVLVGIHSGTYTGKADPNWSGLPAEVCGSTLQLFGPAGEYQGKFEVAGADWVESSKDGDLLALTTVTGVQLYNRAGQIIAPLEGDDPVFSADGKFIATVVYDSLPFDFDTYAIGAVNPAADEKLVADINRILESDQSAVNQLDDTDDADEPDYTGQGFTIIWNVDGSEHMRLPGTDPVFANGGLFTVGGFKFEGFVDDDLRHWGLYPLKDGGPYDTQGGRAPFLAELEGYNPVISADGEWIATEIYGGTNIYSKQIELIDHVAGSSPSFIDDLPVLVTQAESWTRMWYLPRLVTETSKYFPVDPESDFVIDYCLGVPYGLPEASKYLVEFPDKFYFEDCDAMPPTMPWLTYEQMQMEITRPLKAGGSETIVMDVTGCNISLEKHHGPLYLQTCGEGFWRLFNLDTLSVTDAEEEMYIKQELWPRIKGAVFSPDGKHIAAVSSYGVVRIWNIEEIIADPDSGYYEFNAGSDPLILLFSPDSQWLLTASAKSPIILWDLEGDELTRFPPPELNASITDITFTADGSMLHVRIKPVYGMTSYWSRILDFETLLEEFAWVPDLSFDEREMLELDLPRVSTEK